ncbi:MAG: ferrous iron transport protein B [Verrucomicrobia bacterium CG_4_10_14_3_um_filter_43_23]|nr:MAG: ferrous iron transport protein B [Verrucomicrobia bacterium CG1_02_43_26]PIP59674.1 MAG: ferrous iron transport protein B [Verrucomicrobia bacterium CG22_combo_CG10-13_8_21_14_all_43_17]PIX58997.1 MAG: ferrous iron transport protein B [Verrucomicrobia bacterium CG_4_10_14_3_um_filter_43_23]PIY63118.1 MAG: ferrous iron transport protein B [Verrucomicrobia bacterium CG_4_10_14_0_8_um_filter_43_34]PJA43626.1 MAG: ferrous iron transport protein B [Verrucomicrobia bacterium CG_4_9_14_3_um_fi
MFPAFLENKQIGKKQQNSQLPPKKNPVYALVGNPNSGKTTIFNQLTGLRQKVANYSGVTVEKKTGICFSQHGQPMEIIDLPGAHSLMANSPDEAILKNVLLGRRPNTPKPDRVICVVDASHLERHLYLASQVAELGLPMILVVNMMDVAQRQGKEINIAHLEKAFGIPVIPTEAHKNNGIIALKVAMSRSKIPQPNWNIDLPKPIAEAVLSIQSTLVEKVGQDIRLARGQALMMLTEDPNIKDESIETYHIVKGCQEHLNRALPNWSTLIIESRYKAINALLPHAVKKQDRPIRLFSERIDNFILHPAWGWLVFAVVMSSIFWSIFSIAEYPKALIETFFQYLSATANNILPDGPIKGLIADGIIVGVGNIVVFLPQIMILFFFIGLLESSGYLPRAAFLLDKVMRRVGLQGKSFIPLLSSFACAIPGIMATRTIASTQERLATILVAPWMSCSARLPVYLLMIGTLFPNKEASAGMKALILFLFYMLGIAAAFVFAWIFRKTLLKGKSGTSFIELPPYRLPSIKNTFIDMLDRGFVFLKNAGTVILPLSILLWFLVSYPNAHFQEQDTTPIQLAQSYAGKIGKAIEPVIQPLGFDWKIGVGLVASFAAREVFVSTMAILYNAENVQEDHLPEVLQKQKNATGMPIYTPLTSMSVMIFFVFAMQCMSTLGIVRRETNSWKWPAFQFFFMTGFAYLASLIVYQGGLWINQL